MNRAILLLAFLSLGCNRTERERPGDWDGSRAAVQTSVVNLGTLFYWTAPFTYKEDSGNYAVEPNTVGISALAGGIAGGAAYELGGGAGLAWGGSAIGIGLWEFVLVGALVAVAGYGIYSVFSEES